MRIESFSTDAIPRAARVRAWHEVHSRVANVRFSLAPIDDSPFEASITAYRAPRLQFMEYRFSPHVTTYRPQAGKSTGHFILAYLKEGSAVFAQDGREANVGANGIVLFNSSRPLSIQAEMRVFSFDIGRERMKAALPQVDGLTSIALNNEPGAGSLLRSMLDELIQSGASLNDQMCDRLADAIPYVVAAALSALPEAAGAIPSHLEAYHRQRIREFVRSNLRNPDLKPEIIADAVGLSLRYVYNLFDRDSATLMRWIWSQRLQHCRNELSLPSLRHRTIAEIAYSWGFSSQAHFSRMFRAQIGKSPRSFRERALR